MFSIRDNTNARGSSGYDTIKETEEVLQPGEKKSLNSLKFDDGYELKLKFEGEEMVQTQTIPIFRIARNHHKVKPKRLNLTFKDDRNNCLVLVMELTKKSSYSLDCVLYCPYLVYNQTEMSLFYKCNNQRCKVDYLRDLNIPKNFIFSEVVNQNPEKHENLLLGDGPTHGTHGTHENLQRQRAKEYTRLNKDFQKPEEKEFLNQQFLSNMKLVEMYNPIRNTGTIKVSLTKHNWSKSHQ